MRKICKAYTTQPSLIRNKLIQGILSSKRFYAGDRLGNLAQPTYDSSYFELEKKMVDNIIVNNLSHLGH